MNKIPILQIHTNTTKEIQILQILQKLLDFDIWILNFEIVLSFVVFGF